MGTSEERHAPENGLQTPSRPAGAPENEEHPHARSDLARP
jgi:hypothetical protein